jgi:uncharacterized membrane protein YeaQ/YmgE (transglycosylase-associated protein family)
MTKTLRKDHYMGIVAFIIFGAIVGWIASMIAGTNREQGFLGNIVVGILGSFLGGIIMNALGGKGVTGFDLSSFIVALLGAVILLMTFKAVRGPRHKSSLRS